MEQHFFFSIMINRGILGYPAGIRHGNWTSPIDVDFTTRIIQNLHVPRWISGGYHLFRKPPDENSRFQNLGTCIGSRTRVFGGYLDVHHIDQGRKHFALFTQFLGTHRPRIQQNICLLPWNTHRKRCGTPMVSHLDNDLHWWGFTSIYNIYIYYIYIICSFTGGSVAV
jgi:hypothetical protein